MKFDPLECRGDYNLYEPHSVYESVTSSLTLISHPKFVQRSVVHFGLAPMPRFHEWL